MPLSLIYNAMTHNTSEAGRNETARIFTLAT